MLRCSAAVENASALLHRGPVGMARSGDPAATISTWSRCRITDRAARQCPRSTLRSREHPLALPRSVFCHRLNRNGIFLICAEPLIHGMGVSGGILGTPAAGDTGAESRAAVCCCCCCCRIRLCGCGETAEERCGSFDGSVPAGSSFAACGASLGCRVCGRCCGIGQRSTA